MCLNCRIQSLFLSLGDEVKGKTIGLGGDGRYYNKEAAQTIIKLAAANGIKKVTLTSTHADHINTICDEQLFFGRWLLAVSHQTLLAPPSAIL